MEIIGSDELRFRSGRDSKSEQSSRCMNVFFTLYAEDALEDALEPKLKLRIGVPAEVGVPLGELADSGNSQVSFILCMPMDWNLLPSKTGKFTWLIGVAPATSSWQKVASLDS